MAAKKVLKGATKRKVKVFVVLLVSSFVAWLISQLSEIYTERITFELEFTNVPDSLMLMSASSNEVRLTVRGSGWQFLGSRFSSGQLSIDLGEVVNSNSKYYLREQNYRDQVASALPEAMSIVQMDTDTIFFDFSRLIDKKIPVEPDLKLQLAQNYLLEGEIEVIPDSIVVRGPAQELDTLMQVFTERIELTDVSENLERTLKLIRPVSLANTRFEIEEVKVKADVFRFSEKILDVPVEVVNLPEETQVRTFPNSVEVLCKARLDQLKELSPSDFRVVADLQEVQENSTFLPIRLVQKPEDVPNAQLLQVQVEFILKRE